MRRLVTGVVVFGRHGASLLRIDRAHRGLLGDERRRADRTCTRSKAKGRSAAEDGAGVGYFASRCKGGLARRRKIVGHPPLPGRAVCRPDRPLRRRWAWSSPTRLESTATESGMRPAPPRTSFSVPLLAANSMNRATSSAAICTRNAARTASTPSVRRSSLKSPSRGDRAIDSIPPSFARSIRLAMAPSPAGSSSRAM